MQRNGYIGSNRDVYVYQPRWSLLSVLQTTDALFELFQTPKAELWTAELDGEIVGCCGIYPTKNLPKGCVELVKFYLAKAARGKGIGKLLMEKSLEVAKEYGYTVGNFVRRPIDGLVDYHIKNL